jgi:AcrR family transcriptional regulator
MFGPFYPAPLQEVVNHAERLAELLRTGRLVSTRLDDWAAAWMSGREGEIERFLEHTLARRASGKLDDAAAATILAGYLASLHEGMARRLGLHRPACCSGAGEATAVPTSRTLSSVEELLANLVDTRTEPGGRGRGSL